MTPTAWPSHRLRSRGQLDTVREKSIRYAPILTYRAEATGLSEVIIHAEENFERALRRFKKKCEKAGILSDLRKHRHYEKPSERRKRKMIAAVRKTRRPRHG